MINTVDVLANVISRDPDDHFVDWSEFWEQDHLVADWLVHEVLARGRGHLIYAAQKTGKSLFLLWLAAVLATSDDRVVVIYLDYEMTGSDLYERLADMGYGPNSDLRRLRYALLPPLEPLDTEAGADELLNWIDRVQADWPEHHLALIIDTTSRAVQGDENSADTVQDFYRLTGLHLKRRGVTWVRADHAGKDAAKGPRGSSAKGDDVDIVWQVVKSKDELHLKRTVARMNWVPDLVRLSIHDDPLRFERVKGPLSEKEAALVQAMDRLRLPLSTSVKESRIALREAGISSAQESLRKAIAFRRQNESVTQDVTPP